MYIAALYKARNAEPVNIVFMDAADMFRQADIYGALWIIQAGRTIGKTITGDWMFTN